MLVKRFTVFRGEGVGKRGRKGFRGEGTGHSGERVVGIIAS